MPPFLSVQHHPLVCASQNVSAGPATSAPPGNLLHMENMRFHLGHTKFGPEVSAYQELRTTAPGQTRRINGTCRERRY